MGGADLGRLPSPLCPPPPSSCVRQLAREVAQLLAHRIDKLHPELVRLRVAEGPALPVPTASGNTVRQLVQQDLALHFVGAVPFNLDHPLLPLAVDLAGNAIGSLFRRIDSPFTRLLMNWRKFTNKSMSDIGVRRLGFALDMVVGRCMSKSQWHKTAAAKDRFWPCGRALARAVNCTLPY